MKNTLVVVCIDETDTKEPGQWVSDRAKYDLVYLCYSKDKKFITRLRAFGQPVFCVDSGKWKNLKWFCDSTKIIRCRYGHFWFPDPDLVMDVDSVNMFLRYARKFDLCQPSLTQNSICSHKFLKQIAGSEFRQSEFVEVMCPCFSKRALKQLLWTFDLSYSGYGLDLLWAKYVTGYVIDAVSIRHPRDQGFVRRAKEKGFPEPMEELREIKRRYEIRY